jgi:hypothetical protein
MESCHILGDDTESRDDHEPKLAVANSTLFPSVGSKAALDRKISISSAAEPQPREGPL